MESNDISLCKIKDELINKYMKTVKVKKLPKNFSSQFKDYINNILPSENNNHPRLGIGMDIASKLLDKMQGNIDTNKTCFSDVIIIDLCILPKIININCIK